MRNRSVPDSRRRRRLGAPLGIALLLAATAPSAGAQRVVGTVRDSISRAPIPGAVVTVSDAAGHALRQLITDTGGRFDAGLPPAATRLRVLRIGFRPVERAVHAQAGQTVTLDLRMPAITIVLSAMRTRSEKICGNRRADGGAALELWQQARAGLLATVVAREAVPATVRMLTYRQAFDADGRRLLEQRTTLTAGTSQRPFGAAASAGDFERTGFVVDADGFRTYYAPDADVLLDPHFAADHCFSVTLDSGRHPDEIGLAFEPARSASDRIVDVAGTLWLRAGTPELRSMDFHYVRIEDAAAAANAGGAITFTTMPNGVVVLSRWAMVAPVLVRRTSYRREPGVWQYEVTQVQHIGGILAEASWPGGVHWYGPVGALVGRIVRGAAASPARGVRVWLERLADTVTTDASGAYRFDDLLPGRYTLHAEDPALAPFHAQPAVQTDVVVPDRPDTLRALALLSYADIERRLCQGEPADSATTVMMGRLLANGAQPDGDADLQLTWPAGKTAEGARTKVSREAHGRFYLCNLPRRRFVSVRALRDETVWLDTVVTLPDAPVSMMTFPLAARGAAAATGAIVGFAGDSADAPLAHVQITVGRDVNTYTDSLGNFVVPAVRAGTTLVRARRLGLAPVALATTVPADGAASLSVTMRPVTVLPTVIAKATGTAAMPDYHGIHKFDLFYQRRASGNGGEFFTHDDIERRSPAKLSDLLEGKAARLPQCRNTGAGTAPAYQLFINDLPYQTWGQDPIQVLDAIPPWEVEGLEVYSSVAQLPVEAMGNGCAAIFVWMRSVQADSGQ
jgi:Carboxypeptidase regulatory-like domain